MHRLNSMAIQEAKLLSMSLSAYVSPYISISSYQSLSSYNISIYLILFITAYVIKYNHVCKNIIWHGGLGSLH